MPKSLEVKLELLQYKFKQEKLKLRNLENVVFELRSHFSEQIESMLDSVDEILANNSGDSATKVGFSQSPPLEKGECD